VACDPGVRTFQTMVDLEGNVIEWAKGDDKCIGRLCTAMDKLQSLWSQKQCRHRRRYKLKKAAARIRCKLRNLIDECHKKLVNYLVTCYNIILLPSFDTKQMCARLRRRIGSKTARSMLTWSHYRFKQRLLFKQRERPWCKVVIVDEHHTSMTCPECGCLNRKLGRSKWFSCPRCEFSIDRDVNGARNVLIRFLTVHHTGHSS